MRTQSRTSRDPRQVLVIDVGGTNIKVLGTGQSECRKIPSGPTMTANKMVREVKRVVNDWPYDAVSIGYPGPVRDGRPLTEPNNLAGGWVAYDFQRAFGKPVRIINDAAMQALGSYEGGKMLFLGLGTGLGSALVIDGVLAPMELAHLPYSKGRTYEQYVGLQGLQRCGKKRWRRQVAEVTEALRRALQVEYVVLGGGNAKKLKDLPEGARLGDNSKAFLGGFRLWEDQP